MFVNYLESNFDRICHPRYGEEDDVRFADEYSSQPHYNNLLTRDDYASSGPAIDANKPVAINNILKQLGCCLLQVKLSRLKPYGTVRQYFVQTVDMQ